MLAARANAPNTTVKTKGFEVRMRTQTVTPKQDIYEQITQAVIEAIEAGVHAYRMPWNSLETPVNAANQNPYRGINSVLLWAIAQKHGYSHPQWATYRQWQDLGAQVQKGEGSATVVFWKFFDKGGKSETPDMDEEHETKPQRRCMARTYHVFNATQVLRASGSSTNFELRARRGRRILLFTRPSNRKARRRSSVLLGFRRLHPNACIRAVSFCRIVLFRERS